MKVSYAVIASSLLGVALGAVVAWAQFGDSPPLFGPEENVGAADGEPKVLVDNAFHDFGSVERDAVVTHNFRLTNVGTGTLTLKAAGTTCTRCTIAKLEKPELKPGESTDVVVQYAATLLKPAFRQVAVVLTNDPDQRRLELNISGTVKSRYTVNPPAVVFSKISATATATADVKIYGFVSDSIEIVGHELLNPESAPYFEVSTQPIPSGELSEPGARSGCRLEVTVKPGLPLGPIRQTIRVTIAMPASPNATVDLPVEGEVDADISIVGPSWHADQAKLTFGAVKSSQGAKRSLFVILRGAHRHDVQIKPVTIDPEWIKVTLGEPSDIQRGSGGEGVTQIPLTIEIPPGSPAVNRLGSSQGKFGSVVLETNHPQVKLIPLNLLFVVEN